MNLNLTQRQRLAAGGFYLALVWVLYGWIIANVPASQSRATLWFFAGALMIVLGKYLVEPYFTSPADAIVNGVAVWIALDSLRPDDRSALLGYGWLRIYAWAVIGLATISIATKDSDTRVLRLAGAMSYSLAAWLGRAPVIFSFLYLSASYSYFSGPSELGLFVSAIALWICLTFFDIAGKVMVELSKIVDTLRKRPGDELGRAIGCDNPLLYKVEVDYHLHKGAAPRYGDLIAVETKTNVGSIGMVVNRKHLIDKLWLDVYLLTSDAGQIVTLDLRDKKMVADAKSIFASTNKAFLINELTGPSQTAVDNAPLYAFKDQFVGYVTKDSDINTANFIILRDHGAGSREIAEGTILKTVIYGDETLYQIINGNTREERLEGLHSHGYTVGVARKLGKYNLTSHELETRKWMPSIYSPLFFGHPGVVTPERIKAIAGTAIGRLPDTDLEVRLADINAIVTHNTAILGILGIGKSCLAYEVIKRVVAEGVKVVCIDITNEHKKEIPPYVGGAAAIVADDENAFNAINARFDYVHTDGQKQVPDKSGNLTEYKTVIREDLTNFLFGAAAVPNPPDFETQRRVRIYNVDYHKASKGEKIGFNVLTVEMTQAEKTRVIAEELFKLLMKIPLADVKRAKVLLVFEEAHSLIPEWNSVASDGDKVATSGTAKVILQGRKYGLGSMVITQRTANVSKSILNQCNTIFALRVFDDTGKGFLENYIGNDYAATLATLDERHAIAIGKGLRLKQPVIIQLNDKADVV